MENIQVSSYKFLKVVSHTWGRLLRQCTVASNQCYLTTFKKVNTGKPSVILKTNILYLCMRLQLSCMSQAANYMEAHFVPSITCLGAWFQKELKRSFPTHISKGNLGSLFLCLGGNIKEKLIIFYNIFKACMNTSYPWKIMITMMSNLRSSAEVMNQVSLIPNKQDNECIRLSISFNQYCPCPRALSKKK